MSKLNKAIDAIDEALAIADAAVLDRALRNAPNTLTDADIDAAISAARRDRARFIHAEERRAERDEGLAPPPESGEAASD